MGMNRSTFDALITSGPEEQKRQSKYDRYLSRTISPSYTESLQSCPAKTYMERLTKSSYDAFVSISSDAQGSAVHAAIDKGLAFLQVEKSLMWSKKTTGKSPTDAAIKIALRRAKARAELALREHVPIGNPSLGNMRRFINASLDDYGSRYMSDLTTGTPRYTLASEMPVSSLGLKTSAQVGGILDIALYDAQEKLMTIIDTKWVNKTAIDHGHDYLSVMKPGVLKDPGQTTAAKVYMYSMLERYGHLENIEFEYNTYWDIEDGPLKGRETIKGNRLTRSNMSGLKDELTDNVANVLAYERELASSVSRARGSDVTRALAKVRRGACSPHACAACPFRYQCSFRNFVEEARYASRSIDGETFLDSELRKLSHLDDKEFVKKSSEQHTEFINDKKRTDTVDIYRDLTRRFSYSKKDAYRIATEEADVIAESYDSMRYMKRGLFEDKVVKGAFAARTKLPTSILDPATPATWMSSKLRRNIHDYSVEHVDRLSKSFGVPVNLARELVMDNVFRDRDLAYHLNSILIDNTNRNLENMGVSLAKQGKYTTKIEKDTGFALRQYKTTIDRNFALTVQGALDDEFVRQIMTLDQELLKPRPGVRKPPNIKDVMRGAIDKKLIKTDPKLFLSQVAHSESFGSVLERTRLGSPRFPVGTMIIAGMLSYIAGVDSISRMIKSKQEKLSFYLSHQDSEVNDGSHASVYTSARRLMYSDFGSAVRTVGKRSAFILRHLRNFRDFVKDAITVATGFKATEELTASKQIAKALGYGAARIVKNDIKASDFIIKEPSLLIGGTVAGFALSGILPHLKGHREMKDSVKEKRKRFKRLRKAAQNNTSSFTTPESEIREGYRAHTPIGSSVFARIAAEFITPSIRKITTSFTNSFGKSDYSDIYDSIKKGLLNTWSGLRQRPEVVSAKGAFTQVVEGLKDSRATHAANKMLEVSTDKVKNAALSVSAMVQRSSTLDPVRKRMNNIVERVKAAGDSTGRLELTKELGNKASRVFDTVSEATESIPLIHGLPAAPGLSQMSRETPIDRGAGHSGKKQDNRLVTKTSKHRTPEDRTVVNPSYYRTYDNGINSRNQPDSSYPRSSGKKGLDMWGLMNQSSPLEHPGISSLYNGGMKLPEQVVSGTAVGNRFNYSTPEIPRKVVNVMEVPTDMKQKGGKDYRGPGDMTNFNRYVMGLTGSHPYGRGGTFIGSGYDSLNNYSNHARGGI